MLGSGGIVALLLAACSGQPASDSNTGRERTLGSGGEPNHTTRIADDTPTANAPKALDPAQISKWETLLEKPPRYAFKPGVNEAGEVTQDYQVTVVPADVQMLPTKFKPTKVFAFSGDVIKEGSTQPVAYESSPGATFEVKRGTPARVKWVNKLKEHLLPVDPTLHWANPNKMKTPTSPFLEFPKLYAMAQSPVPFVPHVHGLEVKSAFDGEPEAWFTADGGPHGDKYQGDSYEYPNSQPATALWYHDHTLGMTRLNVYAGLAGMYIIRDPADPLDPPEPLKSESKRESGEAALPDHAHEMPLVIQDKSFNTDGSLLYPAAGSSDHPYWSGHFEGDTNVVNGKVWPKMMVERTRYRFRVLNGANSTTYDLALTSDPSSMPLEDPSKGPKLTVIGSDGGYLAAPLDTTTLRLAPGERADVLIDFSSVEPGKFVTLTNTRSSALGEVVRFVVPEDAGKAPAPPSVPQVLSEHPPKLEPQLDKLGKPTKRTVTLNLAPDGSYLLNGQMFDGGLSEEPRVGSTEDWDIVNISYSDHPIHLHLVQFQILERRPFDDGKYIEDWNALNGEALPRHDAPTNPNAEDYFPKVEPLPPVEPLLPIDTGWKDTVVAPASQVTRIRVRWAPQDAKLTTPGTNPFSFDPTKGPGYVWHCHMLEHEDNEMMRPLKLGN